MAIRSLAATCFCLALGAAGAAHATLALNGTRLGDGFGMTTAIGGFSYMTTNDYTLVSIGIGSNGVLVAPANSGPTYVFNDVDGQTLANATATASRIGGSGFAMATAGGLPYGAQTYGGAYYRFGNNGAVLSMLPVVGAGDMFGLWGNPITGHLLSSSTVGLIDIDPITGAYTLINPLSGFLADGVTVSPDGTAAYVADVTADEVKGYSLVPGPNFGTEIFSTATLGHGSDGMAVMAGACRQAGDIVVNNNDGTVGLINTGNGLETVIASGGNRGDFVSADTRNGTLLLSQNDQIARLTAPVGCGFTTERAPEPTSLVLLGAAAVLLVGARLGRPRVSQPA